MAYNSTGLVVHDADAHIMEPPGWLREHADPACGTSCRPLRYAGGNELRQTGDPDQQLGDLERDVRRAGRSAPAAAEYRDDEAAEIMNRKNFAATGSFLAEDRPRALDLLGFASQLVFNTFHNSRLHDWEHSGDLELAIGAARAHNRGMVEFCSVDPRLLPTLLRAARRPRRAPALADRGDRDGRGRAAGGVGLPADPLPQPRRARPGVGGGQRGGHPDRVPRRRHRRR